MKKIIVLTLIVFICANYSFALDDGDFQYWDTESVSFEVNKDWEIKLEEEIRLGDDGGNLYYNHFDQVKEQLSRKPLPLPQLKLNPNIKNIDDFKMEDIELLNYEHHPTIKAPMAV